MSVTFDEQLAVHDVKIINAQGRFFVVMPSRKNQNGEYKDTVHPINSAFRQKLEQTLICEYENYVSQETVLSE